MKSICVVGSFNIDITTSLENLPKKGETVICKSFEILVGGGKGANQAVSAGRIGANVSMVGCLGSEFKGNEYVEVLAQNNVKSDCVEVIEGKYPGVAFVTADSCGDNMLFIEKGTNSLVTPEYVEKYWDKIKEHDILLLQYEIPMETNIMLAKRFHELGKTVVLDPAPAQQAPVELYSYVDYITPNEIEIEQITGVTINEEDDLKKAWGVLSGYGVKNLIAKRGKMGAYIINDKTFEHVPSFKSIKAVDTTAAGDTFNGVFSFGLSKDLPIKECVTLANAAAGISTTKIGAQKAMPNYEEAKKLIDEEK